LGDVFFDDAIVSAVILCTLVRFWPVKGLNEYSVPVFLNILLLHTKRICTDFETDAHGADDGG
jgi:hypothetical protein